MASSLGGGREEVRLIDAIKEGLHQSMKQHPNLVLMGQDIAEYGGAFKITEGFVSSCRINTRPVLATDAWIAV